MLLYVPIHLATSRASLRHWLARHRLAAGLCNVILLVGIANVWALHALAASRTSAENTRRAYVVFNLAEQLIETLTGMESAYRQYMLTGRDDFLIPYDSGQERYQRTLAELSASAQLPDGDPRIWKRVAERAGAWEREAVAPGIALRRAVDSGRVAPRMIALYESTGNSQAYFDDIRRLLDLAAGDRRVELEGQVRANATHAQGAQTILRWGSAVLAALALLITITVRRLNRARDDHASISASLRNEEVRLRVAMRAARLTVWEYEARSDTVTLSLPGHSGDAQAATRRLRIEELLGTAHDDDRPRLRALLATIAAAPRRFECEWRTTLGGQARWLLTVGRPTSPSPGTRGLIGVTMDVTDRHALQERLRQAMKMDAIGQLAGGVAHDFNNFLTAMLSWSHLAQHAVGSGRPGYAEILEIENAAQRAADLTRQLLVFSRGQTLAPRIIDLNDAISGGASLLTRLVPPSIRLDFSLDPMTPFIEVDPTQLQQVLMNLVVNARDAMPAGGVVSVVTRSGSGGAELLVRDDGLGMDEATKARIFEPFFTTKAAGHGTGLGLSTVYGIVKQSQASIDVISAVGVGTTVRVRFPAAGQRLTETAA